MKIHLFAETTYMTNHYDYYLDMYDDDGDLIDVYSFDSWVATRLSEVRNFYSFSSHWSAWLADIAGDRIMPDETIEIIDLIHTLLAEKNFMLSLSEFLKSHTICYHYQNNDITII